MTAAPLAAVAKAPVPAHPAPSTRRQVFAPFWNDRAGVDAAIPRDRLQRKGAGSIRRCHGCPPVAVCPGKRLERLEQRRSLHLRHRVEVLRSPQPRLHAGHNVLTTQVHLVPKTSPDAGMALPGMREIGVTLEPARVKGHNAPVHPFFHALRALTRSMVFESWQHVLDCMTRGLDLKPKRE